MHDTPDTPKCDKCGAEVTTGLMAVLCPRGRECAFVGDDEHWSIVAELREDFGVQCGEGTR